MTNTDSLTAPAPSAATVAPDPRITFHAALDQAGRAVAAVRPDQLARPTPCDGFDVRGLLGHLVGVLDLVARLGRGERYTTERPALDVANDGWTACWASSAAAVRAAWADERSLERVHRLPWAELDGPGTLATYTNELTVHTWDLARATCQAPAWDDDVVEVAFGAIRRALPATGRAAAFAEVAARLPGGVAAFEPPFAEAVEVTADAPLIDRLVAWNGRRP